MTMVFIDLYMLQKNVIECIQRKRVLYCYYMVRRFCTPLQSYSQHTMNTRASLARCPIFYVLCVCCVTGSLLFMVDDLVWIRHNSTAAECSMLTLKVKNPPLT
jgi:hypothetical protein